MSARVEPEWALATILFADVRGFTDLAERATAREAADYLNAFFAVPVPALARHGGWPHKLLGDGLLGVFGVREPADGHADRALAAAEDMLDSVDAHFGNRCRIGVGVNSGLVLVGSVGGGELVELGVIGDPVNVAARVQDATRALGEPLLVTEATRCLLESSGHRLEPRGSLTLKGRARPVTLSGRPGGTTMARCSP